MNRKHEAILEKAKRTKYKHNMWSLEHMGIDTVYGFMEWAADCNGMYLDLKPSIRYISQMPEIGAELKRNGISIDFRTKKEVLNMCIELGLYKYIILRSDERGSDRGILKIQTYLILKGLI